MMDPQTGSPPAGPPVRAPWLGLSGKLMLLTLAFVMLAEILIFVPSVANFRNTWLRDRLAAARTAALVLEAAPAEAIPEALIAQVLGSVGSHTIAMKIGGTRRLLAASDMPPAVAREIDLRDGAASDAIAESFDTLFWGGDRLIRVRGPAPMGGEFIEMVLNEQPLRVAMWRFAGNILLLSLVISSITGALVYASLNWLIVRPVKRLADSIASFAQDAEDSRRVIAPSGRGDEIGLAERSLAGMQQALGQQLKQRQHLASLGLAVAKINHDLRNMLSSAHLLSDRLASVQDPTVQRIAPKLIGALDRAVGFCQATLAFGKAQELPPSPRKFDLSLVVGDARDLLGLDDSPVAFVADLPQPLVLNADPEQLLRVLLNLCRNALEAMEPQVAEGRQAVLTIAARRLADRIEIDVSDTGPGVPEGGREGMFKPFSGSRRVGSTGLGLAIAADLMRAQGGSIALVPSRIGACFRVTFPV